VLIAEFIGLRRSDEVAMTLARRWSQAMGVLVAVGAGGSPDSRRVTRDSRDVTLGV
jgi:hypothetical protein